MDCKFVITEINGNDINDSIDCINNLDHMIGNHLQNICISIRLLTINLYDTKLQIF